MKASELLDLELAKKLEKKFEDERISKIVDREGKLRVKKEQREAKVGDLDNFTRLQRMGEKGNNTMFNMDSDEDFN
jgi:hypothetical protein